MIKRIVTAAAVLLLASTVAFAGQLVIPAAGTGPGAAGSQWQTELTLHNAGRELLPLTIAYHDRNGKAGEFTIDLEPKATLSIADIVKERFNKSASTGAILLTASDIALRKLGVTSRTFNLSPDGEFGQDIPAVAIETALVSGDTGILPGPSSAVNARFNFGVFAVEETTIEWQLVRADGTVAATVSKEYEGATQEQYNAGVETLFGSTAQDNDVVYARVTGRAHVYGSMVDQRTGDPTYVPSSRTRENIPVQFLGIDLREDGTIDLVDADHDGVIDTPITLYTSRFPNYFRVVAEDPEGQEITLWLIEPGHDVELIDRKGTVMWFPGSERLGTTVNLRVRATDGIDTTDLIIPAVFVQ